MPTPGGEAMRLWRRAMGLDPADPPSAYNPTGNSKNILNNTNVSRNITSDYDIGLMAIDPKYLEKFPSRLTNPYSDESQNLLNQVLKMGTDNTNPTIQTSQSIIPILSTPTENFSMNPLQTPQPPQPQPQENSPSTSQLAQQQSSEKLPTNQKIDNSVLNGAQNQPSQPDSFELARLASGNINDDNLAYVNEIIAAKNAWNQSTTEADKKAAADYATYIRNLAQMNDVDLGQFGDGSTLSGEQANLALGKYVLDEQIKAQKKFQSVQDNLANNYSESSNDHFWRLYDEYRQQGDSDRIAAIKAGRETTGYQQERVQSLQRAIEDYGIEGGVMNQFGVSLLGQLADEDNIMGSAYANAYAMPKLNYEKQQAMAQEILKQNSADQRKLAEMQYNAALQEKLENGRNARAEAQNKTSMRNTDVKEQGATERFNVEQENKKTLEEYKAKNQWELKKFDHEHQLELEKLKNANKERGNGDFTKSAEYKIANDNYERARQAYQDLLKPEREATEEEIENAKAAYEKAQRDIDGVIEKYRIYQASDIPVEELKGNYSAAFEYIQQLKAQGISKETLIIFATELGFSGRDAKAMVEGKSRPHSRTTG